MLIRLPAHVDASCRGIPARDVNKRFDNFRGMLRSFAHVSRTDMEGSGKLRSVVGGLLFERILGYSHNADDRKRCHYRRLSPHDMTSGRLKHHDNKFSSQ